MCAAPWLCCVHLHPCASPACKGQAEGGREGRPMLWAVEPPTPRAAAGRSPQGQGFVPAPLVTRGPMWAVPGHRAGPTSLPLSPEWGSSLPLSFWDAYWGGPYTLCLQVKRLGWADPEPVSLTPARPEVCCSPLSWLGCALRCSNPQLQSMPESR